MHSELPTVFLWLQFRNFIFAFGFSLGAKHDGLPATVRHAGQTETCAIDGGYIMNPKATKIPGIRYSRPNYE